jgi:hypothetical protein
LAVTLLLFLNKSENVDYRKKTNTVVDFIKFFVKAYRCGFIVIKLLEQGNVVEFKTLSLQKK